MQHFLLVKTSRRASIGQVYNVVKSDQEDKDLFHQHLQGTLNYLSQY